MFGRTYQATASQPERRYYQCHGKDCILTARPASLPEPQRQGRGDRGRGLGPRRRPARRSRSGCWRSSTHFAAAARPASAVTARPTSSSAPGWTASPGPTSACSTPTRPTRSAWPSCPSGAASSPRSAAAWSASSRSGTGYASSASRPRRSAPAWRPSATACARRLDEATFADKQAILQLVIERIIVGDGSLEIRHVIPLLPRPAKRQRRLYP